MWIGIGNKPIITAYSNIVSYGTTEVTIYMPNWLWTTICVGGLMLIFAVALWFISLCLPDKWLEKIW